MWWELPYWKGQVYKELFSIVMQWELLTFKHFPEYVQNRISNKEHPKMPFSVLGLSLVNMVPHNSYA